jgi:hypothetical protein
MADRDDESFARALESALGRTWDRAEIARFAAGHTWTAAARAAHGVLESALEPALAREARVAS